MLKQGLTNFFKSLKYFFTPLGTMFLGIMLGMSAFVSTVVTSAQTMADNIYKLSQNVNLDFNVLLDSVWTSVLALDWNNPVEAIQTMFSAEWLNNTLTETLSALLGTDFETFKAQIVQYVNDFLQSFSTGAVVFFFMWILGFIAGYWILRFLIRRNIARRSLWKFILAYFLNSLIAVLFVLASLVVFALWKYGLIFTVIIGVVLGGVIAFVQAYLLYAHKKLKFRQIVNLKNVGMYVLANAIIYALSIVATVVAVWLNALAGIFVGLSLISVAGIVVKLNAESYVIERVKELSKSDVVIDDVVASDDAEYAIDEIK